jgi:hypothetical protein
VASREEVQSAILDEIMKTLQESSSVAAVKDLAEAYAWVVSPGQPH